MLKITEKTFTQNMKKGSYYPKDLDASAENTPPRDNESTIAHSSDPGLGKKEKNRMLSEQSRIHLKNERDKRQGEIENRHPDSQKKVNPNFARKKSVS